LYNICWNAWSLPQWSPSLAKTLAYYKTFAIMGGKSFIVRAL
jgi:hypothetical protein